MRKKKLKLTSQNNDHHRIHQLQKCRELTAVIKEEQIARKQQYGTVEVSDELSNLTRFIIEAINCEARRRPTFEPADTSFERNLEFFLCKPILRKQVLYQQDLKNYTQIQHLMDEHSRGSGEVIPVEYSGPNTRSKAHLE